MFEGLDEEQLEGALEAVLFITDEPVGVITLAELLECEPAQIEDALHSLSTRLESDQRGIQLREVAGGWRLFTHPRFHRLLETYVLSWDTRKLSEAALETLAIIAYLQPVTRANVASVRGVNSDSSINSLLEKGLIREMGTADSPGNPVLYGTSRVFLEKFGLRSVADLPDLAEFAPDEETRRLITERLSSSRSSTALSDAEAETLAAALSTDEEESPFTSPVTADDAETKDSEESTSSDALPFKTIPGSLLAQAFGAVEKIDFDALNFDLDDE